MWKGAIEKIRFQVEKKLCCFVRFFFWHVGFILWVSFGTTSPGDALNYAHPTISSFKFRPNNTMNTIRTTITLTFLSIIL